MQKYFQCSDDFTQRKIRFKNNPNRDGGKMPIDSHICNGIFYKRRIQIDPDASKLLFSFQKLDGMLWCSVWVASSTMLFWVFASVPVWFSVSLALDFNVFSGFVCRF